LSGVVSSCRDTAGLPEPAQTNKHHSEKGERR
jgi:hypothetical protein